MTPREDELIELMAEQALKDKDLLKREATLEAIGIDSVDFVSILFALEDKYGVRIEDDEISKDKTLGEMLDLVIAKIDAKEMAAKAEGV